MWNAIVARSFLGCPLSLKPKKQNNAQEKTEALQRLFSGFSLALHEFSTAVVQMVGTQAVEATATEGSPWAATEVEALVQTASAVNVFAAQLKQLESVVDTFVGAPLKAVCSLASPTLQEAIQDASDARLELESEGKKNAVQMAKKHELARKGSDISFGDLLKIQEPLKSLEKRFETAASTHLSTMLQVHAMRRSVVGNVLSFQLAVKTLLSNCITAFNVACDKSATLRDTDIPRFEQAWGAEKGRRDAAVLQAVQECCFGKPNHVEGYLVGTCEMAQGERGKLQGETKYFCAVQGRLTWFASWAAYEPEEELDLLLYTVRPVEGSPTQFEVQSPMMTLHLTAHHERNRNKWVAVLAECIRERLDAQKQLTQDDKEKRDVLDRVRGVAGNEVCADCDAADPTWACLNYGVIICHQCSGVHRSLGSHVSKVRSLTLDVLDAEVVRFFQQLGNVRANRILEANLTKKKPSNASKREVREEFIQAKYVARAFVAPREGATPADPAQLGAALLREATSGPEPNLSSLLEYMVAGADLKHAKPSLLHSFLASPVHTEDPVVVTQLLVYNDAPLDVPSDTERPLHVAARRNFVASCRVLLRNGADAKALTGGTLQSALDLLPADAHPDKANASDIEAYLLPRPIVRRMDRSPSVSAYTSPSLKKSMGADDTSPGSPATTRRRRLTGIFSALSPGSPTTTRKKKDAE